MSKTKKDPALWRRNIITLRLTDIELENLKRQAHTAGLNQSEYLRKLILGVPLKVNYEIIADSEKLSRIVYELGKIGVNLNQIALHFNTGGIRSLAMEDAIHEAIAQIFEMRKEVLTLGGEFGGSTKTHRKQKR